MPYINNSKRIERDRQHRGYEGDKSGKGRKTKDDCYQQNKCLKEYLPIVKQVFDKVEIKQGMIIAQ